MIIEITSNPHSFIAFLTVSMGISYAFFNRQGFGLGKLFTLVFIGGSFFLTAYTHHHAVDVGLGIIVGFLHAKGMIGVINPIGWFRGAIDRFRWNLQNRKDERSNACAQTESNQQYEDFREQEANKRQEQARRERAQANQKQEKQKTSSNDSNQSQQKSSSNSRNQQYQQRYQKTKPKPPSERDKALAVLGLEPNATLDEAKRARSKLMSLYHPDKLAGLPEGRRNQAEEEAKKINVAWGVLSKKS